jgi:hypothetical protein
MLVPWHLIGRAAHKQGRLGPIEIDAFKVGTAYALPVEGDLLVLRLDGEPAQLKVKRRRFDFSDAEPELHIDLQLIAN